MFSRMSVKGNKGRVRPFLADGAAKVFTRQIAYVKKGYLSDPPGMDMYVELLQPPGGSSKLTKWRCLRSTSALEGYHFHLARCMRENARGRSSERNMTLKTNYFDHRWSMDAAKRCGDVSWEVKHYNVSLIDQIVRV